MQSVLDIRVNNNDGIVERILGRLRQRGFSMCGMTVERSSDCSTLFVQVVTESSRPIEQVAKQLDKLIDVQSVKLRNNPLEDRAGDLHQLGIKVSELAARLSA
jgi:acetolactate synthase II small subunit